MSEPLKAGDKCPQCSQPIEAVHNQQIMYRGRDRITGRQCLVKAIMQFCSPKCGGHYQMGCEG